MLILKHIAMPRSKKKLPLRIIFISVYCTVFEQVREILAARFARNLQTPGDIHFEKASAGNSKEFVQSVIDKYPDTYAIVFDSTDWPNFEAACKKHSNSQKKFFYTFNGETLWMLGVNGTLEKVDESTPSIIVGH